MVDFDHWFNIEFDNSSLIIRKEVQRISFLGSLNELHSGIKSFLNLVNGTEAISLEPKREKSLFNLRWTFA